MVISINSDPAAPIHVLYPVDQRAECVEAVAHESRIFCGLSFDFPLDLSGVAFTDAVRILPEHCRKAGAVLHFADVHAKAAAKCAKLQKCGFAFRLCVTHRQSHPRKQARRCPKQSAGGHPTFQSSHTRSGYP